MDKDIFVNTPCTNVIDAEDLFSKLEFRLKFNEVTEEIEYYKMVPATKLFDFNGISKIVFNKNNKTVELYTIHANAVKYEPLTVDLIKAINQQIEELGWSNGN